MPFNERHFDEITMLDFSDRLTYTAGLELGHRVSVLAATGIRNVVLNLEHVTYVDSAGLGALVDAFTQLRHAGGALRFVGPTIRTQHLLQITGIASLVQTFTSESAALASFEGGSPTGSPGS